MTTYDESRFGKKIEDMTLAELQSAKESMEEDFREYRRYGEGISTKETVTHRDISERIVDLTIMQRFGIPEDEVQEFKRGMREMFAPAEDEPPAPPEADPYPGSEYLRFHQD